MGERPCLSLLGEDEDEDEHEGELKDIFPDSDEPGDRLTVCPFRYLLLEGEIRSPFARMDSVEEFKATTEDETRLRFRDELGLSSSSPSSYPSTDESVFSASLGMVDLVTQLSKLLNPMEEDEELEDSKYL